MEVSLLLVALVASTSNSKATQKSVEAFIQQHEIDDHVEAFYRRSVDEDTRMIVSKTATLTQMVIERRIVVMWRF